MAVSVVSFSFSMVVQPEHWHSLLHVVSLLNSTRLSPQARWTQLTGTQLSSVQFVGLILPSNSHAVIWTRLCNSFRYLATGMCHFGFLWNGLWSSSSGNNCHPVQRSLSSGASVYESIMGFFYLVSFHQPISAHAISSHNCYQNVSLPSGALPWMAFLAGSTGQNITITRISLLFSREKEKL